MEKTVVYRKDKLLLINESKDELEIHHEDIFGRDAKGMKWVEDVLTVSRKHAQFIYNDYLENWYLKDLGSTNKTYINGMAVTEGDLSLIRSGDKISFSSKYTVTCIY